MDYNLDRQVYSKYTSIQNANASCNRHLVFLAKPLLKKRQQIAITNLKIAFPEKSDQENKKN